MPEYWIRKDKKTPEAKPERKTSRDPIEDSEDLKFNKPKEKKQ